MPDNLKSPSPLSSGVRTPVQARSQQRVARVMAAAERLLEEVGPEKTSIPEIVKLSGIPRSSIYQFFPDKSSLFSAITRHHLANIALEIAEARRSIRKKTLKRLVETLMSISSNYYNNNPAASALILGGTYDVWVDSDANHVQIGRQIRLVLGEAVPPITLPEEPDTATLALEIGFACLRHGYRHNKTISASTCRQACRAVEAYLATCGQMKTDGTPSRH